MASVKAATISSANNNFIALSRDLSCLAAKYKGTKALRTESGYSTANFT